MINDLETEFKIYRPCLTNQYWDGFDDTFDMIVFDEFRGSQINFSLLKVVLDGQPCKLPCRYYDAYKTKNVPVIILCNYPPSDCYEKMFQKSDVCLEEFMDRVEFIDLSFERVLLHIFKY